MDYKELIENPYLQDLPFKIELDEHGTIQMTPASNRHGNFQVKIGHELFSRLKAGEVMSECSIETSKGVKVANVAWAGVEFIEKRGFETPYPVAPELCVEIVSPSNSRPALEEKIGLYLARGAKEVWLCDEEGQIEFHSYEGRIPQSRIVPDMPPRIVRK